MPKDELPQHLASFAEALSGASGAILSCLSLYPLEMLKQQLAMAPPGKTLSDIISDMGGIGGLYGGMQFKVVQVVVAKFCYFYVHSGFTAKVGPGSSTGTQLAVGYASDWAAAPFTLPLEALITKVQKAAKSGKSLGLLTVLRETLDTEGFFSLYGGLRWQALVSLMPAIQQVLYDNFREIAMRGQKSLTAGQAFLIGALARLVALSFVFPAMRIKTMVQAGQAGPGPLATLKSDPRALYQGFVPEAVRGVLSSALLFMIKEILADRVKAIVRKLA
eukprot:Hpha_TRINITY_DN18518_c0_g1::TRINITY_DN18518_c0_g1_i1::g.195065::m.195065